MDENYKLLTILLSCQILGYKNSKRLGQIAHSPLYVSGQFQFPPLSIKLSNVFLYLLKLSTLPLTSIFLLNTNRTLQIV